MEKEKGLSRQTILTIAGIALIYVLAFLLDRSRACPSCSRRFCARAIYPSSPSL